MAQECKPWNEAYTSDEGSGSNALDFHIAYSSADYPRASCSSFTRVKGYGFDPLIRHLKAKGISCQRTKDLLEVGGAKLLNSSPNAQKIDAVIDDLAKRNGAKPRTLKTLRNTVRALFVNQLSEEELDDLIGELTQGGIVKITDGQVHYKSLS